CRGNCADLPIAPQNSNTGTNHKKVLCETKECASVPWPACKLPTKRCTSSNPNDPAALASIRTPSKNPTSPNRVTTNAFLAAFAADGFCHQNPTRRYEQIPTSSQHTYS